MPPQYRSISADSHVVEPPELFIPLQDRFGERAPLVVFTERMGHQLYLGDGTMGLPIGHFLIAGMDVGSEATRAETRKGYGIARKGVYDIAARLADQELDGVAAEVLYPSVLFNVYQIEDTAIVHATFQAYNDWLADYVRPAPDRLFGLGAIQLRDIDSAIDELHRVKELGFVGVCIPCTAPSERPYSDAYYDPFWEAAQALRLPLTMHIFTGATPNHGLPKWPGVSYPLAYIGIEVSVATLILSGVCERFPELIFVPTEFETGWVGNLLRRLDHAVYRGGGSPFAGVELSMKPSDYWRRNFRVTFEDDCIGIRTRDFIGVENLLWGSDYPHGDSIFPESQRILDDLFATVDPAERYAITAGSVVKLYGLPFPAELSQDAERYGGERV
jgi:predicted TIM-barrel fold metal-dependent hydrolase